MAASGCSYAQALLRTDGSKQRGREKRSPVIVCKGWTAGLNPCGGDYCPIEMLCLGDSYSAYNTWMTTCTRLYCIVRLLAWYLTEAGHSTLPVKNNKNSPGQLTSGVWPHRKTGRWTRFDHGRDLPSGPTANLPYPATPCPASARRYQEPCACAPM